MSAQTSTGDDVAIKDKLTELFDLIKQAQNEQSQKESNVASILAAKEKWQSTDILAINGSSTGAATAITSGATTTANATKATAAKKSKLRALYKFAIHSHEHESKALRNALNAVIEIRQTLRQRQRRLIATAAGQQTGVRRGALMKILQQSASALPLFIPETRNDRPPPLCGCIPADPNYIARPGDLVAAFVPSPDGDGSKVWVLGEVLQYVAGSGKYEIDDIDEEQKERHLIGRRRVIPLPVMRANPQTNPEALFAKDSQVLALYPQTTCFYRAIIDRPPSSPAQDYMVSFEDATYTEGYSPPLAVPQRYVIAS